MAFHCGVLRWLAETERLERISQVSTVSGGTLACGLILTLNGWRWPTSAQYLAEVSGRVKAALTGQNIVLMAIGLLPHPRNWRYVLSRANVLAQAIETCWRVSAQLSDLPRAPVWTINGTTAETGRRFRFKSDRCGDYELGYADASDFPVSQAMAMSAALPGIVGPLAIVTRHYTWKRRPAWNAPSESEQEVTLPYRRLHLYDGGLYDNLALEPLMDPGLQVFKNDIDYLMCSDAGAPLARTSPGPSLNPFRIKRILDIALDQTRSLRIRALAHFLECHSDRGAYAQMGADPVQRVRAYAGRRPEAAKELSRYDWLPPEEISLAASHPTTLWPLTPLEFDRLERHGYESIRWNELLFGNQSIGSSVSG
jgi:NTE family protein